MKSLTIPNFIITFMHGILLLMPPSYTMKISNLFTNRIVKQVISSNFISYGKSIKLFSLSTEITPPNRQKKKIPNSAGNATESKIPENSTAILEDIRQARINKIGIIRKNGGNPFAYTYSQAHKSLDLFEQYKDLPNGEENVDANVSLAGRVMVKRVFGKLAFFQLQDDTGTIQLYIEKGRLNEEFDVIKDLTDAGDIIGVTGTMKRTDKGELSVYVNSWTMLTKSILPLPDKYHGLQDVDKRYRQRHLDMIVNPQVRETFRARARITQAIRNTLDNKGFLEVRTTLPIILD